SRTRRAHFPRRSANDGDQPTEGLSATARSALLATLALGARLFGAALGALLLLRLRAALAHLRGVAAVESTHLLVSSGSSPLGRARCAALAAESEHKPDSSVTVKTT